MFAKNSIAVTLILVSCVCLLTACTRPYRKGEVHTDLKGFPGLFSSVYATDTVQPVDVVSIHGMCTHGTEWVDNTAARLKEGLRLARAEKVRVEKVAGLEIAITHIMDGAGTVALRDYAIVWSPLTQPQKQSLCYDSNIETGSCAVPGNDRKRADLNGVLKSDLMNDCFSDAMIYLGHKGPAIREAFRAAIEFIQRDRDRKRPLFLISESLGSKVLIDAVWERRDESGLVAFLLDSERIFMAANQIALLDLADDIPSTKDTDASADTLARLRVLIPALEDARKAEPAFLVAFTDPSDLLTYELKPEKTPFAFANVLVSNASIWFGFLERPDLAHQSYLDNDTVWKLVACGYGSMAAC